MKDTLKRCFGGEVVKDVKEFKTGWSLVQNKRVLSDENYTEYEKVDAPADTIPWAAA